LLASDAWRRAASTVALRQVAGAAKWSLLARLLGVGRLQASVPTLVWCQYKHTAHAIHAALLRLKVGAAVVTGALSAKRRQAAFEGFQESGGWLVLTQCAQAGVQLQRARVSVIVETPYESRARSQATARMWRIGQTQPTEEITLAWIHEIDDHVMMHVDRKAAHIERVGF
jgi:SNF2 family DNA or RNA helicase